MTQCAQINREDSMRSTAKPLISVIMSAYNESIDHITQSINSILEQTYPNFEFIIILDNPQNKLIKNTILTFASVDSRIIFKENSENIGLACSLNEALKISRGDFIARMDSDDISLPNRLSQQLRFLEDKSEVDLVGSAVELINDCSNRIGLMSAPNTKIIPSEKLILYQTVAYHPTWMFRRKLIEKIGGYNNMRAAQDYEFLSRAILSGANIQNIPDVLVKYRIRENSTGNSNNIIQLKSKLFAIESYKKKSPFRYFQYEDYIRTAPVLAWLHGKSSYQYFKYTKASSKIMKFYFLLTSAVLSPYALRNYIRIFILRIELIRCRIL